MPIHISEAEFDHAILRAQPVHVSHAGIRGMAADCRLPQGVGTVKYSRAAWEGRMTAILAEFNLCEDMNVTLGAGNEILVTFVLDGGIKGALGSGRSGLDFRVHCALMRLPTAKPDVTVHVPGRRHNAFVQLRIAPAYFRQWLADLQVRLPPEWTRQLSERDGRVLHNSVWTVPTDSCLRQIVYTRLPRQVFLPYLGAKALELLTLFTHELTARRTSPVGLVADKVALAEEILMADLANAPTISDLARRLDWNATDLKAAFRRRFGAPIGAYVMDARLRRAAGMLETTHLSVFSVALECGWQCQARFAQAFKSRFGLTPTAYRGRTGVRSASGSVSSA